MKRKTRLFAWLVLLLASAFSNSANASAVSPIVVGTTTIGNCIPFTCNLDGQPGFTYQQVYSQTVFPGPILINELTFYRYTPAGDLILANGIFDISLSTTTAAVHNLSTTSFSDNLGPNNKLVYSGPLPAMTGDQLIIPLSSNFLYNPTFGNLLMTVSSLNFSTAETDGFFDTEWRPSSPLSVPMSRATTTSLGTIGVDDLGLVTGFGFVPPGQVPLPAALPLFASGLVGLGLLGWRRKKTRD